MLDKICTLIKTNSSYSYLWPVIKDLCKGIENLIILVDEGCDFDFGSNSEKIYYNSNLNYTRRLSSVLERIESEYIFLLHDVDLILNLNQDKFNSYLSLVEENSIDRLSFGVYNGNDILNGNNLSVCRLYPGMSDSFFTPFDYSPSIYRKDKLVELYLKFPEETYGGLELNPEVQNHVNLNMKCYGIKYSNRISTVYHRGFVFTEDANFIHITVKGKLLPFQYYYDLEEKLVEILNKYSLINLEIHKESPFIKRNTI